MQIRRIHWTITLVALALAVLLAAACAPVAAPAPSAPPATSAPAATSAPEATSAPAATDAPAATEAPSGALQPITFQAGFLPQGNISFVPAYIAKEKGFFEDEGLDVTIEHSSPGGGEQSQRLAAKNIQFTTHTAENFAKQMEAAAPPFIGVAVLGHATDHGLIVLEDSEIQTIEDLRGKKIGIKTGEGAEPPWLLRMLQSAGMTFEDVELVQVGFDPRVILPESGAGQVDALQVFKSNEPDTLARMGFNTRLFKPEDFGSTFLGQMYVTNTDFVRDDPEMVQAFVNATLKGLEYAMDPANKSEVTDIVMKYAGENADREHNEFMWNTEIQYVTSPDTAVHGLGYASPEEWNTMMETMVEFGSLKEVVPLEKLFDPQFVEAAGIKK
jgi:ABC-type nitrate/sulfonate/bicarbonate transport system substrate-binding protein